MNKSKNNQQYSVANTNKIIKQGLKDLDIAEQRSDNISKNLFDQNKQIDNIIGNVEKSQQSVNESLYTARGLKSFFGSIMNYFSKPEQIEEDKNLNDINAQQQANNVEQNLRNNKQQVSNFTQQKTGNPELDEQNELLRLANQKAAIILSKQTDINKELVSQYKKLEIFEAKGEKLQNSMNKFDKDIKKI